MKLLNLNTTIAVKQGKIRLKAVILRTVDFPSSQIFPKKRSDWVYALLSQIVKLSAWGLKTVFSGYVIPYEWAAVMEGNKISTSLAPAVTDKQKKAKQKLMRYTVLNRYIYSNVLQRRMRHHKLERSIHQKNNFSNKYQNTVVKTLLNKQYQFRNSRLELQTREKNISLKYAYHKMEVKNDNVQYRLKKRVNSLSFLFPVLSEKQALLIFSKHSLYKYSSINLQKQCSSIKAQTVKLTQQQYHWTDRNILFKSISDLHYSYNAWKNFQFKWNKIDNPITRYSNKQGNKSFLTQFLCNQAPQSRRIKLQWHNTTISGVADSSKLYPHAVKPQYSLIVNQTDNKQRQQIVTDNRYTEKSMPIRLLHNFKLLSDFSDQYRRYISKLLQPEGAKTYQLNDNRIGMEKSTRSQRTIQQLSSMLSQQTNIQQQEQTLQTIQQQLVHSDQSHRRELHRMQEQLQELKTLFKQKQGVPIPYVKPPSFFGRI